MISVAPAVPPVSVHQCLVSVPTSAHQCHISVPCDLPFSVTHQCLSVSITAASLAHISEGEKSLIYKIL
ncbi:unnamed protein product [Staurois parvus]|uniref:Uncharacterized protein n=1 Tax=Staurois parvus TaxID=386267 RepID=A0ABN9EQB8_9NEOB|nr:unnamed protein product [Staurois parvus]